jgi:ubiquinone/menaquinone biosynthesis C-methylase UbiE
MNTELQVYQKKTIDCFNEVCSFIGKKVLEIGGSPPYNVAREFLNRGARNMITIDYRTDIPNRQIAENLQYLNMDARDLKFPRQEFDLVFGVAVLEHLHNLDKVLAEISRVLVKGGYAYLHGAPLWSCRLDHHVWVRFDDVKYEFHANNPIPDWHHLIF